MRASAQRMVGAGKSLSVGLTAPIVAFGVLSVKAFAESQTALSKLNNTIQNSPQLAGESIEAFEELASAIQRTTAADDESVLSAAAVLGQFKLTGAEIRRTLPLIVDYARKTGTEVPDAAQNIGRALLGNTRALKAIGISYTSTGDAAKDFENIIARLQSKVGGFARGEADDAAVKLEMMKNRFNEMQEQIGGALMPVFDGLLTTVGGVTRAFEIMPVPVKSAIGTMVGIAAAAGPILLITGKIIQLRMAMRAARLEGGLLSGTFGKFGAVLGPLTAVLALASAGFAQGRKDQENLRAHIQDKLVPAFVEGKLSQEEFTKATEGWVRLGAFTREEIDGWVAGLRTQQTETKNSERELEKYQRQMQATTDTTRVFANMNGKAFKEWRKNVQQSLDPISGALADLGEQAEISSASVIKAFRKQAKNLKEYRENLADVQKRNLPEGVLKQLLDMGTEGADILAVLADANKDSWKDIVDAMRNARREMRLTKNEILGLPDANVEVGFKIGPFGFNPKPEARAAGGPVYSMRPYLVGERGPEMFVPKQDGRILPNGSGGGGGNTFNVTVNLNGSGDKMNATKLARELAPALEHEFTRRQKGATRRLFGEPV